MLMLLASCLTSIGGTVSSQAQSLPKAPATSTALSNRPDSYQTLVLPAPSGSVQDFQLLTGPGMTTARPIVVSVAGTLYFDGLSANGNYTFRSRNRTGVGSSAWKTFSFKTAAAFAFRSPSPTNLVVATSTATTVTLDWTAPVGTPNGSWTYVYYINGVFQGSTTPSGAYGGLEDNSLITIPRPAPSTSIVFGVAARDNDRNTSLPTEIQVVQP
jgi:hypothetical protein